MKNILIAYFSHSGNTEIIATVISEKIGGKLFKIETVNTYPIEYNAVVAQARKELDADYRPVFAEKVDHLDQYDVIFIGYPNWWNTMPMGVFAFLEANGFSGKTIIPFCTHEGSGLGRSARDIQKVCPEASVLEGLAIRGSSSVKQAEKEIAFWLNKLGIN